MKSKKITKLVYITADGKEFLDKTEAEEYEKQLTEKLSYAYYTVLIGPDTTEGRGWYETLTLAVKKRYGYEKYIALQYLVDRFKRVLDSDIGGGTVPNFMITKEESFKTLEELGEFRKSTVNDGIGDYRRQIPREIIYLGTDKEKVFEVTDGE